MNQINAILWKNLLTSTRQDILKETFIPFLSIIILAASNYSDLGTIFLELMIPIYIPSAMNGLARQLLCEYVQEKASGLRDIYAVMGMKLNNYRIAWLITYFLKSLIVYFIMAFGIVFLTKMSYWNGIQVSFSLLLMIVAVLCETLLLSSLFKDAQLAGELGSFLLTMSSMLYFVIFLSDKYISQLLILIFPQSAFSLLLMSKIGSWTHIQVSNSTINLALLIHCLIFILAFIFIDSHSGFRFTKKQKTQRNEIELQHFKLEDEQLAAISINNLTKNYGNKVVLNDITISINQEIFCLLGHNGAGKTTTLKVLTGLVQKTSGSVSILGLDIDTNRQSISRQIGYCSQDNILYPRLTTIQSIMYQGLLRGLSQHELQRECLDLMTELGIFEYANIEISKLSGGNRRKVAIAVALIGGSQIIFLDEPTCSLDPTSRRQIWDILLKLHKTIILTTHFMDEAEFLADRIGILKKGEIVCLGTAEEIKRQYNVGYILKCYGNVDSKHFTNENIKIENGITYVELTRDIFEYYSIIKCLEKDIQLQITQNTLEDAYLLLNREQEISLEVRQLDIFQIQLTKSKTVKFLLQVVALIMRKLIPIYRNFSIFIMIFLPLLFLVLGVFIGTSYMAEVQSEMKSYFVSLFLVQSFSLNSSIFINQPIVERELRIRQQFKQIKVRQSAYWIGTFLSDYFIISFSNLCIYFLFQLDQMGFYQEQVPHTMKALQLFGASIIIYSYLCSFLFKTASSAYKIFPVFNFLLSYTIPQLLQDLFFKSSMFETLLTIVSPLFCLDRSLKHPNETQYLYVFLLQQIIMMIMVIKFENNLILFDNNVKQGTEINLSKVSHQYSQTSHSQLNEISLQFPNNSIVSLLGPNGAGKSTLIQLLTNCQKLQKGRIQYNDQITIAACQQEDAIFEDLSPIETAIMYSLLKGATSGIIQEVKNILTQLSIFNNMPIKTLSGGQKRKVSICTALVGCDNYIILDEPSNGLDPVSRRNLEYMLKEHVQKYSSSIILTTHNMDEAQRLSDRIAILINGEIVENDISSKLIDKFGTTEIILEEPVDVTLLGDVHIVQHDQFSVYLKKQTVTQILDFLSSQRITKFQIHNANLEQVFLKLTKLQHE